MVGPIHLTLYTRAFGLMVVLWCPALVLLCPVAFRQTL